MELIYVFISRAARWLCRFLTDDTRFARVPLSERQRWRDPPETAREKEARIRSLIARRAEAHGETQGPEVREPGVSEAPQGREVREEALKE